MTAALKNEWRERLIPNLAALLSGGLFSLGFLPVPGGTPSAACCALGLSILFLLIGQLKSSASPAICAILAFLFGLSCYASGLFWVWHSLYSYGQIPAMLSAGAVLLLAGANALFPTAAALAAGKAAKPGALRMILFALLFFIVDWLRGSALCSFPWISFGYALVDQPLSRLVAPLAGVWGVELAGILSVLLLSLILAEKKRFWAWIFIIFHTLIGLSCLCSPEWSQPADRLRIRLVQPMLPVSGLPGQPEMPLADRLSASLKLSSFIAANDPTIPRLVAWPESVISVPIQVIPNALLRPVAKLMQENHASLAFNAFWETPRRGFSNSLFLVSAYSSPQRYDKRHLVPFGEYVPSGFRWLVDALHIPMGDLTPGANQQAALRLGSIMVAPMICYENLFGDELRTFWTSSSSLSSGTPNLLLVASNLEWFSPAVMHQHLQMSQMRAMETARPLASVNNNGLSAVIDSHGRILAMAGIKPEALELDLKTAKGSPTPYSRAGDLPAILLALLLLAATLAWLCKENAKNAARI